MPEPRSVSIDAAPAGWLICADRNVLDVDRMIERFGQVYRCAISATDAAAQLAPGQPCFLLRTDRSRVVGLWAVGSVVAPILALDPTLEHPAAGRAGTLDAEGNQWFAEVELLPLQKPIALAKLLEHDALDTKAVRTIEPAHGPVALSSAQVRAIESFDFWIEEPTDDQRAQLDRLLDAEESAGP